MIIVRQSLDLQIIWQNEADALENCCLFWTTLRPNDLTLVQMDLKIWLQFLFHADRPKNHIAISHVPVAIVTAIH